MGGTFLMLSIVSLITHENKFSIYSDGPFQANYASYEILFHKREISISSVFIDLTISTFISSQPPPQKKNCKF